MSAVKTARVALVTALVEVESWRTFGSWITDTEAEAWREVATLANRILIAYQCDGDSPEVAQLVTKMEAAIVAAKQGGVK
jgi:hypothetical protein